MEGRRQALASILLGACAAAWIAGPTVVATGRNEHWSSPIVLGFLAAGGASLIFGAIALSPIRLPRRSIIGVSVPDVPCPGYNVEQEGRSLGSGCYCHLEVRSLDPGVVLQGCRARLIKVERVADGAWVPDTRFTAQVRLKWAHADPKEPHAAARDIEADFPQLLDVVHTAELAPTRAFIMSLDAIPVGLPTFLEHGVYRLTIRFSAENSPAADYGVMLTFTAWNAVALEPALGSTAPSASAVPVRGR